MGFLDRVATRASTAVREARQGLTGATFLTLVVFVLIDQTTRRFARVSIGRMNTDLLGWEAFRSQPALGLLLAMTFGVVLLLRRDQVLVSWTELDNGRRLRAGVGVIMVVVSWRLVAGPFNYLFGEWYVLDRILLVVFVGAALVRPVGVLFVIGQVRLLQAPLRAPDFAHPGLNIEELAILIVAIVAAVVLLTMAWPRYRSAAALPIMLAAFGAQFFLPGRTKVRARWFENDIANLPLSGYAQGWLGDGDGSFARGLSDTLGSIEPLLIAATLLFEVGVVVVVFRRRLLLGWLIAAVGFHVAVYLSLGFVFFEFVVVEVVLAALVWGTSGRSWANPAFTTGPAIIGAGAIVLGPMFFHPPTLAWFDSNLSYAYEIDGVAADGSTFALVPGDFAPYDDIVAFADLGLGPTVPLAGAYGAASRLDDILIENLTSMDDVASAEGAWSPDSSSPRLRLLQVFLESTQRDRLGPSPLPSPPLHFDISRSGARYDFETELESLVVERVTTLRTGGEVIVRREQTVVVEMRDDLAVVKWP